MADLPPQRLRLYWCPLCGRHEITAQAWHVPAGELGGRCPMTMRPVEYELAVDRDFLAARAYEAAEAARKANP